MNINPTSAISFFADVAYLVACRRPVVIEISLAITRLVRANVGFLDRLAVVFDNIFTSQAVFGLLSANLFQLRIAHHAVQLLRVAATRALRNRVCQTRHFSGFRTCRTHFQKIAPRFQRITQLFMPNRKIPLNRRRTLARTVARRQAQNRLACEASITGQHIVGKSRRSSPQHGGS